MSVIDRLQRLQGEKPETDAKQRQLGELRRRIEKFSTAAHPAPRAGQTAGLAGTPCRWTPWSRAVKWKRRSGKCIVLRGELDLGHFWGRRRLREGGEADSRALAVLAGDERWPVLIPTRALFSTRKPPAWPAGTGTLAFLIGLGWFAAGTFCDTPDFRPGFPGGAGGVTCPDRSDKRPRLSGDLQRQDVRCGLVEHPLHSQSP
jgi:hypothetical protein